MHAYFILYEDGQLHTCIANLSSEQLAQCYQNTIKNTSSHPIFFLTLIQDIKRLIDNQVTK